MFCVNTLPSQFPPPSPCRRHCRLTVVCSPFRRRSRSRRRHNKLSLPTSTSFEPKLEAVIDLTPLTAFQSEVGRFLSSGRDAYRDLQTLVTLDHNRRLVVSCRPSTLHFLGTSAALSFLAVSVFTVLAQLISRFSSWVCNASSYKPVLVRRDRSLGGKEVVVAWGQRSDTNPLSPPVRDSVKRSAKNKEEYKTEAYRVVRAITNSRLGGNDIMENDIIQLRRLCRTSGVQVSIEPTNIRDTLYRASVNFVLNVCSRAPTYSTSIDINGEDAPQFLAGFAENIGLENVRAATIVSAAVAAHTRSCLLQAWALKEASLSVEGM